MLSFFEAEPTLTDSDAPWAYNCLSFSTQRGADSVDVEIEPGNEELRVRWSRDSAELATFDMHRVKELAITTDGDTELLSAEFRDAHLLKFELRLKPTVRVRWGTGNSLP